MRLRDDQAHAEGRPAARDYRFVPYARIAQTLKRAVLVTEDSGFWDHDGIEIDAIKESLEASLAKGAIVRGGSTITQQLAKNLYLSPSQNPLRKLRELMITHRLERLLSKRRILELYLNVVGVGWRHVGRRSGQPSLLPKASLGSRRIRGGLARRRADQSQSLQPGRSATATAATSADDPATHGHARRAGAARGARASASAARWRAPADTSVETAAPAPSSDSRRKATRRTAPAPGDAPSAPAPTPDEAPARPSPPPPVRCLTGCGLRVSHVAARLSDLPGQRCSISLTRSPASLPTSPGVSRRFAHVRPERTLVFARRGRTGADGPNATCHCLTLPTSEPGYYFWADAVTGTITRRSPWFVTTVAAGRDATGRRSIT